MRSRDCIEHENNIVELNVILLQHHIPPYVRAGIRSTTEGILQDNVYHKSLSFGSFPDSTSGP